MSRFMVQTIRFRFLVVALLVICAAEPGALAQSSGTGGGTVYFWERGANMWSMNSDGSNKTLLGNWTLFIVPSRELHNGYRWYLTTVPIPDSYYPDGITMRSEVFAVREDYDWYNRSDTLIQLTDDETLEPFFPLTHCTSADDMEWAPGDRTISFKARRWLGDTPVEGGLYTADLAFRADGNIIGLVAKPTTPTLAFPLNEEGKPKFGTHSWDDTGARVVYNDGAGLWVADLSSGKKTQIFSGFARYPDWSPDGTKIAMTGFTGQSGHIIYTIKPNGTGLKAIITPTYVGTAYCRFFHFPYFSSTGSHIVCLGIAEHNEASNNEVFRATVRGRDLTNLTQTSDINECPLGWREEAPPPPPPGITVTPIEGLVTTEGGGTDVFGVVLNTEPTAAVTIYVSTSDVTEGLVSTGTQGPAASVWLAFDSTNWNVPQTVTVHGLDDAIVDGNIPYTVITAPAVSGDLDYNELDADDVSVTNFDDDGAGTTVSSIWPDSMNAGTTIPVTITGSGFQSGATVTFENGSGVAPAAAVTFVSANGLTIEATVTAHRNAKAAVWDVRVTNPDTSTDVLTDGFTVIK